MKRYGQFCPVAQASELFCERWTPLIIRDLSWGASRFSELQRGVPLMSPSLLSKRLKQLEAEGILERRRAIRGRAWTYHLTAAGQEFVPIVEALGVWGQHWTRRELADGEVDLGLLIWALERSVNPAAFGAGRTVVEIDLVDQPKAKRRWWFVCENDELDLCVDDPGFEVDLLVAVSLRDIIHVVRGDLSLARAIDTGRLRVHGPARLRRALRRWLNLSPLAAVRSRRVEATGA